MSVFGVHIDDDPNHILDELDRVYNINGNFVQLFVYPQFKNQSVYTEFYNKLKSKKMYCVVHASYTINIAGDWDEYSWWVKQFIAEISLADVIGAIGIVIHMGKQLDLPKENALNNMYSTLLYVHNKTKQHKNVKIILETPTGQGSELCYNIEDLAYFFKKFSSHPNPEIQNRFKICLDTCHIFSAGYDIRTKKSVIEFLKNVEKLINIKNVALIHLNDSRKELGSHVDRHENLGKGFIGKIGLKEFAKIFKEQNVPIILETSGLFHKEEIKNYLL